MGGVSSSMAGVLYRLSPVPAKSLAFDWLMNDAIIKRRGRIDGREIPINLVGQQPFKQKRTMGSGWSSDTSSQSSDCDSDPHEHLVTKDDVSVTSTAEFNTAGPVCSSSHSLIEQPKPYIGVDTPQEAAEGLLLTKHSATGGSCAWSIDLSDWAGKRKKIRGEKRPKVIAGRPAVTATRSQTEPACEKSAPSLLPVVELRDGCEVGKLAVSPEDLSTRKFLDLKRWYISN